MFNNCEIIDIVIYLLFLNIDLFYIKLYNEKAIKIYTFQGGSSMNDSSKVEVAICGYGNLGKGCEQALVKALDMELVAIFTRRDPAALKTASGVPVVSFKDIEDWKDKVDVVIMCGGSATDLPEMVTEVICSFNTVDSFDTHAKIPEYFDKVNTIAKKADKVAVISGGWDPGMFSLNRLYASAILPEGETYTFWGKGVSQGHSDAIRRIEGVKDARQYTIPIEEAMERVRKGENPKLTTREKHLRECYVVAENGADLDKIEREIKGMPNYFADYDTVVHFITEEKLKAEHSGLPHGGFVIRSGETGDGNKQTIEYSLKLDSNPEFTGSVLVSLARAAYRMYAYGDTGAKTIFDIPPKYLSPMTDDELRKKLL